MNKDGVNKVVNPLDFDKYLSEGWVFGNTTASHPGIPAWNKGLSKYDDERVMKISKSKTGVPRSDELKHKLSIANLGKKQSEQTKLKRSLALQGHSVSDETRYKISSSKIGHTLSKESREKISRTLSGRQLSDEHKENISKALKGRKCPEWQKQFLSDLHKSPQFKERINNIKRQNKTFTTSNPEENYYNSLVNIYGEDDIIRQYTDKTRYPFNCDFYIKSIDTFIELNLHWTHGKHPFNPNSETDLERVRFLKEKSKDSAYYANALYVWTDLDVRKASIAKANNLNYEVIYKL